jgi:hypothetical protein
MYIKTQNTLKLKNPETKIVCKLYYFAYMEGKNEEINDIGSKYTTTFGYIKS